MIEAGQYFYLAARQALSAAFDFFQSAIVIADVQQTGNVNCCQYVIKRLSIAEACRDGVEVIVEHCSSLSFGSLREVDSHAA